ncbi:MAG: glutathione S-transferase family protein [Pseudomonas sp.]|uniref:glutathione S-transferase family protein n=1 Tax=Pseudomonas sp. TaxID=306 RepID=UPI003399109F
MATLGMTLFHSTGSPFVRKVMLVLHETGQLEQVALHGVQLSPINPSAALNAGNPAGKLPALGLADGSVLHDSRVICDYLDQQHGSTPLIPRDGPSRWQRLTLASLADALMDAAVLIRYETFLRPADKRWDDWVQAQQGKIDRGLAQLEHEAASAPHGPFDIAAIGIVCLLGYLDFRQPQLGWRTRCPQLADWYAAVQERPSVQATQPSA